MLDSAGQAIAVVKHGRAQRCNEAFLRLLQAASRVSWRARRSATASPNPRTGRIVGAGRRGARRRPAGGARTAGHGATFRPGRQEARVVPADAAFDRSRRVCRSCSPTSTRSTPARSRRGARGASRRADRLAQPPPAGERAAAALGDVERASRVRGLRDRPRRLQEDQRPPRPRRSATRCCATIALRLMSVMRPHDTVARRGGDEFALLVPRHEQPRRCRAHRAPRPACGRAAAAARQRRSGTRLGQHRHRARARQRPRPRAAAAACRPGDVRSQVARQEPLLLRRQRRRRVTPLLAARAAQMP